MIKVAITQRVEIIARRQDERCDALDQRWSAFLLRAGFSAVPIPNIPELAAEILSDPQLGGLILSGGNTLMKYGGDAPERDETEERCVRLARSLGLPIFGVCRGMQFLLDLDEAPLEQVEGHVAPAQKIMSAAGHLMKNSYQTWGIQKDAVPQDWKCEAWTEDGVAKAIRRGKEVGIMWHPERLEPFHQDDILRVRSLFGGAA